MLAPFRPAVTVPLAIAVVLLYALIWREPVLDGDSAQYLEVARDLQDGRLDSLHYRAPGYPALLVLTGAADHPSRLTLLAALMLHGASILLLAGALRGSGASDGMTAAFAVVLALPPFVEPAAYVMTENLAQFTLAAGFAALWHGLRGRSTPWLCVAGLAFGTSALVRPVFVLLGPAVGVALLCLVRPTGPRRMPMRVAAAALLAGAAITTGAVALFNYGAFGYAGVAPSLGFHLSTRTTGVFERLPDEYAAERDLLIQFRDRELTRPGGRHDGTQAVWEARTELMRVTGLDSAALSDRLVRMNAGLILAAPFEYAEEVARSFGQFWLPATRAQATFGQRPLRWLWWLLHAAIVLVFFWQVALIVAASTGRRGRSEWLPANLPILVALGVVAYTALLSCALDIGEPRQRQPVDPFILFVCAAGLAQWRRAEGPTGAGTT